MHVMGSWKAGALERTIGPIFDRASDALIIGDASTGRIVMWNESAAHLFGYTAHEAVGMSIETLVPSDLRDAHRNGIASFRASGRGPIVDHRMSVELPAVRQDGETIWVEL